MAISAIFLPPFLRPLGFFLPHIVLSVFDIFSFFAGNLQFVIFIYEEHEINNGTKTL